MRLRAAATRGIQAAIQRNEVIGVTTLLEGWSKVVRILYRQLRRDGTWQLQDRDLLDRGHGITVLLFNQERKVILLLKQPRITATMNADPTGEMIEACNGLIENESPLDCAFREVLQETGHRPLSMVSVAEVFASPGASLEVVHLFFAEFDDTTSVGVGGGLYSEGEDIELLEVTLEQAMRWINDRTIRDARTILVLQFAYLRGLFEAGK